MQRFENVQIKLTVSKSVQKKTACCTNYCKICNIHVVQFVTVTFCSMLYDSKETYRQRFECYIRSCVTFRFQYLTTCDMLGVASCWVSTSELIDLVVPRI